MYFWSDKFENDNFDSDKFIFQEYDKLVALKLVTPKIRVQCVKFTYSFLWNLKKNSNTNF